MPLAWALVMLAQRHRKRADLGPVAVEDFIATITAEIAAKTGD